MALEKHPLSWALCSRGAPTEETGCGPGPASSNVCEPHCLPRLSHPQDHGHYLGNSVMLQLNDARDSHLHTAKYSHHLQNLIIERRSCKSLKGPALRADPCPEAPRTALCCLLSGLLAWLETGT